MKIGNVEPPLGRKDAVRAIASLFTSGERLVALLGPPGAGKSHVASFLADNVEGAVRCDLSDVPDADTAMSAVAAAIGAKLSLDESVDEAVDQLGQILADRGDALLILDHGERVDGAAPAVATWLRAAPRARVLWVGRQRLGLVDERPYDLPPLSLEGATPSDAATLFARCAARVRPGFTLSDPDTWNTVEELVRRLDGLPLAIELAASRMRILGPAQLLKQLESRFELLAEGEGRALRTALDESWETLSPPERETLSQCAVFASGFSPEAALTVVDLSMHASAPGVLDVLTSLRDRSLLTVSEPAETPGELRFGLLHAVRDYAREALLDRDGKPGAEARHADYYLLAAEEWIRGGSLDGAGARARLSLEIDNLRAVLDRALEVSPATTASGTTALRAALALEPVLWVRGPMSALLSALDSALRVGKPSGADPTLVARARRARWDALQSVARSREVLTDFTAAREIAHDADDPELAALLAEAKARHSTLRGRLAEARAGLEEALEIHRRREDDVALARTLNLLGNVAQLACDLDRARALYEESLVHARRASDLRLEALVVGHLATLAYERHDDAAAESAFLDACDKHRRASDPHGQAITTANMGLVSWERGDVSVALTQLGEALDLAEKVGSRLHEGVIRAIRGVVQLSASDTTAATQDLEQARERLHQAGDARTELFAQCGLLELAARNDDASAATSALEQARTLYGNAEGPVPACLVGLAEARLESMRALALLTDDAAAAATHLEAARERLAAAPTLPSAEVRAIRRFVEDALRDPRFPAAAPAEDESTFLLIGNDGRWFRAPGGEPIDIATRGPLRRIVAALSEARIKTPPIALDVAELLERGWPGERVIPEAAKNRVYVAVATLRKLGLKEVLLRRDDGYVFDPKVSCRMKRAKG